MEFDAMNAGVNPGGLQSRLEIRVLICCILDNTTSPVPLNNLIERLHFEGIANYFESKFAMSELEENGCIYCVDIEDRDDLYDITADGKTISLNLGKDVPFSVRERSLEIAEELIQLNKNKREHIVKKEISENGIYVTCRVMEKDLELVSVRMLVPDESTAEIVKNNFLKKPMETLIAATTSLTGTKL